MAATGIPDLACALDEQLTHSGACLRILHVISGLSIGGAERQLVNLSRELLRRDHKVLIYTLNAVATLLPALTGSGVEVITDQKRLRLDPLVIARLRRTARAWGADIAHGWLYDGNLYTRIAMRGLGIPVINSERSDNYELTRVQRLGYALTRRWETALIANTHAGLEFASRLHRLPRKDAHVVWNGIDLAALDREAAAAPALRATLWPDEDVLIASLVGSVTPPKDHLLALETAAVLHQRDPRWRFLFIGKSPPDSKAWSDAVRAHLHALKLETICRFTAERSDAIAHIAASDVLFSTSQLEGFPNVVLEAMACGTPVASTDYSDIRLILPFPWQIASGRSPATMADAIQRVERERRAVATAQRVWVERHAASEHSVNAMETIYTRYASSQSSGAVRRSPASWIT